MVKKSKNKKIFAVLDDMFFSSKIREAAKGLKLEIDFIKGSNSLTEQIEKDVPSLLIVDLNTKLLSPLQVIRDLKSSPELMDIPLLGYFSHVQTELKEEAAKAGCNMVYPKSKFSKDLRSILINYSN